MKKIGLLSDTHGYLDDAILNHQKYPNIFIDDNEDPIRFYLNEIEGKLSQFAHKKTLLTRLKKLIRPVEKNNFEDNLFDTLIPKIQQETPLFLLDSAGGLGYLEFKKVKSLMNGYSHFLILDDIHHLKHFRSYEDICADDSYTILAKNLKLGWVIAKFSK